MGHAVAVPKTAKNPYNSTVGGDKNGPSLVFRRYENSNNNQISFESIDNASASSCRWRFRNNGNRAFRRKCFLLAFKLRLFKETTSR